MRSLNWRRGGVGWRTSTSPYVQCTPRWQGSTAEPGAASRAAVQLGHRKPGELAVQRREAGDTIELVLAGELVQATRELVRDPLVEVRKRAPQRLVLELSGLTLIDVSGLQVLLAAVERCRAPGAPALELFRVRRPCTRCSRSLSSPVAFRSPRLPGGTLLLPPGRTAGPLSGGGRPYRDRR